MAPVDLIPLSAPPDITLTVADVHLIADLQLVADLRAQLSDELGRITNLARERVVEYCDYRLHALALRLAGHVVEAVHLKFLREADQPIPVSAIGAWIERAMLLLCEVAQVHTPYQPRNDISTVPPDVTADVGVAA